MSNRYAQKMQDANKGFTKTPKKFIPKTQPSNFKDPNSTPPLSNSLRQYSSKRPNDAKPTSTGTGPNCGNFVNYFPHDEAVAAGLGAEKGGLDPLESQRVVDLLNKQLSRLLKLNPREFWREVASDTSLHEFLDSFLQFRSRWYDFPYHGAKEIVAGVIVGELELSRRVFMVLYRISSHKDPGARPGDSLSLKDHGVLLQEKKLLDLPKLLDICAIYGHENDDLTKLLVGNAFKAQPVIHDNLSAVISHFLGIVHTMNQRCSSCLKALSSSGSHEDHGSSSLFADLLDVMDFINDAVVSMDALVSAYKPAAVFFCLPVEMSYGNEELLIILARLHDTLLPSLQRGFRIIFTAGEDGMTSNIAVSLKMLSMRIVKFGWKLLDLCYLNDEVFEGSLPIPESTKMFPAKVEDPVIRADILVQTFREIDGGLQHALDNQNGETFLQNVEKNYNMMSKFEILQNTGWILMDEKQFIYLSGVVIHPMQANTKKPHSAPTPLTSKKVQMDEDTAILESKISQIKDLFPDFGKGFLAACLAVYNHDPEKVIQRILEGTLHEDLQSLDSSMEKIPPPKSALSVSKNDKGKGKLVDSTTLPTTNSLPVVGKEQIVSPSFSSSSSVGRYVRKTKAEVLDHDTLDVRDDNDSAKQAVLISQYEYEDEYDDSFDDLGLSVGGSGLEENEILADRISSNSGESWGTETESSSQSTAAKWGSCKNPQFYVKDGKNYSYKVAGSIAVANSNEASLVSLAQNELIYGLGRGGNLPLGAVKKLTEYKEQNSQLNVPVIEGTVSMGNPRGRGKRGGGRFRESQEDKDKACEISEVEGRGNMGNPRGRGRRGGGRNHYRKDQAMNKHFSGLSGY